MPPEALEIYKKFERTLLAELEDGEQVEAITAAVLANNTFRRLALSGDKKKVKTND